MKKILVICCLFLIGSIGFCADWQEVGYKIYVDISSGKKYSNGNIEVWTKVLNYNVNENKIRNERWHYTIGLHEYNCKDNQYLMKYATCYGLNGNIVLNRKGHGKWEYIVPDSRMETIHKFLCNNYGNR